MGWQCPRCTLVNAPQVLACPCSTTGITVTIPAPLPRTFDTCAYCFKPIGSCFGHTICGSSTSLEQDTRGWTIS